MKTHLSVLHVLACGDFVSGEAIAQQLGLSRMAISKAVKKLVEQGLDVSSVSGKGYQLKPPVQLLDVDIIKKQLSRTALNTSTLEVLHEVGSTSDYLLEMADDETHVGRICVAEYQSSGRGRRQRNWYAGAYRNISLSVSWNFDGGMNGLSGLGIAAGIALVRALHGAGCDKEIGLKWPNDLVWKNKKLGGLLIDVRGVHDGPCIAVLGLGLNLYLSDEDIKQIDQPAISLDKLSPSSLDKNTVVALLLNALIELFKSFPDSGFKHYHALWPEYDRLQGRVVTVMRDQSSAAGIAAGIDEHGALLLEQHNGETINFYSGEVSVRLNDESAT